MRIECCSIRLSIPEAFQDDLNNFLQQYEAFVDARGFSPPTELILNDESTLLSDQEKQVRLALLNSLPARLPSPVRNLSYVPRGSIVWARELTLLLRQNRSSLNDLNVGSEKTIFGNEEELLDLQDALSDLAMLEYVALDLHTDDTRGWSIMLGTLSSCTGLKNVVLDRVPDACRASVKLLFDSLKTNQTVKIFEFYLGSYSSPADNALTWDEDLTRAFAEMLSVNNNLERIKVTDRLPSIGPIAQVFSSSANTSVKDVKFVVSHGTGQTAVDVMAKALRSNYHIQNVQIVEQSQCLYPLVPPQCIVDERIEFFLRHNRSGTLRKLYENQNSTSTDWIEAVVANHGDLSSIYYFVSKNPAIVNQIKPCIELCRTAVEAIDFMMKDTLANLASVDNEQAQKVALLSHTIQQILTSSLQQTPGLQDYSLDQLDAVIKGAITGAATAATAVGVFTMD